MRAFTDKELREHTHATVDMKRTKHLGKNRNCNTQTGTEHNRRTKTKGEWGCSHTGGTRIRAIKGRADNEPQVKDGKKYKQEVKLRHADNIFQNKTGNIRNMTRCFGWVCLCVVRVPTGDGAQGELWQKVASPRQAGPLEPPQQHPEPHAHRF